MKLYIFFKELFNRCKPKKTDIVTYIPSAQTSKTINVNILLTDQFFNFLKNNNFLTIRKIWETSDISLTHSQFAFDAAAYLGKLPLVRYLVNNEDVNINHKSNYRYIEGGYYHMTALDRAASNGHYHVVTYLLREGAFVSAFSLGMASRSGSTSLVEQLFPLVSYNEGKLLTDSEKLEECMFHACCNDINMIAFLQDKAKRMGAAIKTDPMVVNFTESLNSSKHNGKTSQEYSL